MRLSHTGKRTVYLTLDELEELTRALAHVVDDCNKYPDIRSDNIVKLKRKFELSKTETVYD